MFAVVARANWHTFQLLTKRHGRMRSLLSRPSFWGNLAHLGPWPPPNVWLGVSAEHQHWWDIRVPALVATPAAVRFVSAEPLLGPIDMGLDHGKPSPDWLIIGGESGIGARPVALEWVRSMLAQCQQPGIRTVPLIKQLGSIAGRGTGRGIEGRRLGQVARRPEVPRVPRRPCGGGHVT